MSVHLTTHMYTHFHTHVHTHVHTHFYAHVYAHAQTQVYAHAYAHVYAHVPYAGQYQVGRWQRARPNHHEADWRMKTKGDMCTDTYPNMKTCGTDMCIYMCTVAVRRLIDIFVGCVWSFMG